MHKALPKALETPKYSQNNVSTVVSGDLERVVAALLQRDVSRNTQLALRSDLKCFLQWYAQKNGEAFRFQRVVMRDITDFRDDLSKTLSPATTNRRLVNVRLFLQEAVELDVIPKNPAKRVKQVATQSLASKGLTKQEARRLMKEVEIRANLRDLAAVNLMLMAGLRAGEVVALTVQDVEMSERRGTLTIRRAKGNKTRRVPIHRALRAILEAYIDHYKPTDKLLLGERGAIQQLALNEIVRKYAKLAGVTATPHTLRHSWAYQYLEQNPGDIVGLAQLLGHSSISTTQIYVQHRMEQLEQRVEAVSF
ncbi:MAG: tyrosine-type recombinase/integrase [Candidatus Peribacteraceae bacterium]|nr:tyrosine-type recombinase/integrase [Candidatus Peribacteraceae bacterium]